MVDMGPSEEFNHELKAEKYYSKIMIEMINDSKVFEEAKKIIEDFGIHILETRYLSPKWVLIKLNAEDIRDVSLKLIEHGFSIKGINALP